MKAILTLVMLVLASTGFAQTVTLGSGYMTPMHKGTPITFQQVIAPKWGEVQLIGSPNEPIKTIQLVKYSGSWRAGAFSGKLGPYTEYSASTDRLATVGMFNFLRGKLLGGKVAGPFYLGYKPSGGPIEFNAPQTRILWEVDKAWSVGFGSALYARSSKPTVLQIGPMVDWHKGHDTIWLRICEIASGHQAGGYQIRVEGYHSFF